MGNLSLKESKFWDALRNVFVGEKLEGQSGFINLMKIKSKYYEEGVFPLLREEIDAALESFPEFREELFEKLYAFFSRYFTESGSIYFRQTAFHDQIYDRVYTENTDVMLFWKTRMLFYVKSDRLFSNLDAAIDGQKFSFDLSSLEHKRANEKRDLTYELKKLQDDGTIILSVSFSEKGRLTKVKNIISDLKKKGKRIDELLLERAFRLFERQSEVDYFINKNAKGFLEEQLSLWLNQYVFVGENVWGEERVRQIQALRKIGLKIIAFISQFEEELTKIWNKPKFVLDSHYVITLERIADRNIDLVKEIVSHSSMKRQMKEWKEHDIIDRTFSASSIFEKRTSGLQVKRECVHLPIDTRFFPDLEQKIVSLFDNLDEQTDGWLIASENYQALRTILPKFKGRIQTIYIDPPFNKEQDADYFYSVKYKDASWITILENRLWLARDLLEERGGIFVRCDCNGNMFVRMLMDQIFGKRNFLNELQINRTKKIFHGVKGYNVACDSLFFYGKGEKVFFVPQYKRREKEQKWLNMHSPGERRPPERTIHNRLFYPPKGRHWTFRQEKIETMLAEGRIRLNPHTTYIDMRGRKIVGMPQYLTGEMELLDSNWIDIPGYTSTHGFPTENSETLLKRVIESNSKEGDLVMDFFLGSGTTIATAHKLKRKWIGIEQGLHFQTVILPRMKQVLAGKGIHEPSGISRESGWKGGGMFKYYQLEQYEDTLRRANYEQSNSPEIPNEEWQAQYVFLRDLKLLEALKINFDRNSVDLHLGKLYEKIDLAESLSHLSGKWIKQVTEDRIVFQDGETLDPSNIEYRRLKPLIWW